MGSVAGHSRKHRRLKAPFRYGQFYVSGAPQVSDLPGLPEKIRIEEPSPSAGHDFVPTGQMGLENDVQADSTDQSARREQRQGHKKNQAADKPRLSLGTEEYHSVMAYEVSEVDFEEFLSSSPTDSAPASPDGPELPEVFPALDEQGVPRAQPALIAEADLIRGDSR